MHGRRAARKSNETQPLAQGGSQHSTCGNMSSGCAFGPLLGASLAATCAAAPPPPAAAWTSTTEQ